MKRNEAGVPVKHKARFVAKGYSQQFAFDVFETWAPVSRSAGIIHQKCSKSLAAMQDCWECEKMDVDTAFLHAPGGMRRYTWNSPQASWSMDQMVSPWYAE